MPRKYKLQWQWVLYEINFFIESESVTNLHTNLSLSFDMEEMHMGRAINGLSVSCPYIPWDGSTSLIHSVVHQKEG